jgi:hypothetical protein
MVTFFAEIIDSAFTSINVFSSRDLDRFSVDKSISHLLSCPLEVAPESFSGYAHFVSSLVLLHLKKVAKTNSLKLFYGQVGDFQTAKRDFSGLVIGGLWKARYPAFNSIDHQNYSYATRNKYLPINFYKAFKVLTLTSSLFR